MRKTLGRLVVAAAFAITFGSAAFASCTTDDLAGNWVVNVITPVYTWNCQIQVTVSNGTASAVTLNTSWQPCTPDFSYDNLLLHNSDVCSFSIEVEGPSDMPGYGGIYYWFMNQNKNIGVGGIPGSTIFLTRVD